MAEVLMLGVPLLRRIGHARHRIYRFACDRHIMRLAGRLSLRISLGARRRILLLGGADRKRFGRRRRPFDGHEHPRLLLERRADFLRIDPTLLLDTGNRPSAFRPQKLAPKQGNLLKNWRSLLAGAIFGLFLIPYKFTDIPLLEFMSAFTIGIFIAAQILVGIIYFKHRDLFKFQLAPSLASILMGLLWTIGQHGCFWAIDTKGALGYAVGYPLTQLNLLVNLLWGVIVFHEYPTKPERIKLAIATSVILVGAVLLALSKM